MKHCEHVLSVKVNQVFLLPQKYSAPHFRDSKVPQSLYDSRVYVYGDIPNPEFVVWSLSGINLPSLSPESQSQYTPDSAGGSFTQPHKSISKSQKPVRDNTEVHTVSKPNIDAHIEKLLVKHFFSFLLFIQFSFLMLKFKVYCCH